MTSRVRRTLFIAGAVLVFFLLAGATYQGVATALERRQFPHPGKLVDVGGHQLHLYCEGNGLPTVVLEAPAAGMSAAWGWVHPRIAQITRVCSYDRAGLGWSEAGDRPYDPAAVPEQLRTLLQRANEKAPYVLVGHDLGAALATVYAARFGEDLAALVLVDAPSQSDREAQRARLIRFVTVSPWLARAGVLRASRLLSGYAAGLPGPSAGPLRGFLNRPDHLTRAARELARWDDAIDMAAAATPGLALRVITVETPRRGDLRFLNDPAQADVVSAAIEDTVRTAAPESTGDLKVSGYRPSTGAQPAATSSYR